MQFEDWVVTRDRNGNLGIFHPETINAIVVQVDEEGKKTLYEVRFANGTSYHIQEILQPSLEDFLKGF